MSKNAGYSVDEMVGVQGEAGSVSEIAGVRPKVAFVCNHNSCRSQIAEALGKQLAGDVFDCYSAGTIIKSEINPDAVRLVKSLYNIDMTLTQYNKKIDDIPAPDIVVLMGLQCGLSYAPCRLYRELGVRRPVR